MIKRNGFTLIEIMIVMVIIGMGLLSVMPMLGERAINDDPIITFFDQLIDEHYKESINQGVPVKFKGFKGSANIVKYDGTRVSIPDVNSVQSAQVNKKSTIGIEYDITVYPDGLVDYFVLETDNKLTIESAPIHMKVKKSKKL